MRWSSWLAAFLSSLTFALAASTQPRAVKLWPQITAGIYNHADVLAMKCEVAEDGLTVTDAAWDTLGDARAQNLHGECVASRG